MGVALALPLASCLWQWLCHLPMLAWYIRGFLSNHVSGNGSTICSHTFLRYCSNPRRFCGNTFWPSSKFQFKRSCQSSYAHDFLLCPFACSSAARRSESRSGNPPAALCKLFRICFPIRMEVFIVELHTCKVRKAIPPAIVVFHFGIYVWTICQDGYVWSQYIIICNYIIMAPFGCRLERRVGVHPWPFDNIALFSPYLHWYIMVVATAFFLYIHS